MSRRVTAQCFVELKVVVHVGNWDAATSFEALERQALREAEAAVRNCFKNSAIQLTGQPGVMSVTVKECN